jgi:peptidyl-prolyl cis-trans isomerase C
MRSHTTARLAAASLIAGFAAAGSLAAQEAAPEAEAPEAAPAEAAPAEYDAGTVLATVDGIEITLGHVVVLRERLPEQFQALPDETLMSGLVDQLVDQILLARTVSEDPDADPLGVRLHLENERRGTLASVAVTEQIEGEISEADVQAKYEELVGGFEAQPEFSASHIIVPTEEEAAAIKAELDGGADFATVAAEKSQDGAAANGGSLGWFGLGQMVPEFETAVQAMEVGEVAGPVQTQFGWHLIKLDDTRETAPPPVEEVRDQIVEQIRQERLVAELEELRGAAEIERPETGIPASAVRDASILDE